MKRVCAGMTALILFTTLATACSSTRQDRADGAAIPQEPKTVTGPAQGAPAASPATSASQGDVAGGTGAAGAAGSGGTAGGGGGGGAAGR